jgi:hypothetical protein
LLAVDAGVHFRNGRSTRTADVFLEDDPDGEARQQNHQQHTPEPRRPASSCGPTGEIEVGG